MQQAESRSALVQAPSSPATGRLKRAGIVALIAVPFVVAFSGDFPICPMAGTLGIPCPGCGLTRATLAVLHGHLWQGMHLHPLVLLVTPIYVTVVVLGIISYVRGPPALPQGRVRRALDRVMGPWAMVTIVLLLSVWVARFFGYFGGPVPVETVHQWVTSHVEPEVHHVAVAHDVLFPLDR